jgi:hypothetical protein
MHPQKGLLRDICSLLGITGHAKGEIEDHLRVPPVDLFEGRSIAVAMALDQFQVGVARRSCHENSRFHGSTMGGS